MSNNSNKVTIKINDIDITVDLNKTIAKEVKKALEEIEEPTLPFTLNRYGRTKGNTYRILLYAQLLASSEPNRTVFVLTHTATYARELHYKLANSMYSMIYGLKVNTPSNTVTLDNGSRIIFIANSNFSDRHICGLRDAHVLYDNSTD